MDDSALQAARDRAKATVENAYKHHWKIKVTLTTEESFKGNVEQLQSDRFTFQPEKTPQSREVPYSSLEDAKRLGMSTGKKWAIAGGIIGGLCLAAVVTTKPWRSE